MAFTTPQAFLRQATPSGNPPTNYTYFWVGADNLLYVKDDSGSVQTFLNSVLASGQLLLGNGSNVATAITPSGVVVISNAGVTSFHSSAFGTSSSTACRGDDSRLSDARTPTAHASTHADGGSDEIEIAESQVTNLVSDLALKAPLASPTFTGTPAAPTASAGTNTTQLATTAFVGTAIANLVGTAPGVLDTLGEIADALNDDAAFSATIVTALAGKQPLDATLTALAGISTAADKVPYFTGTDTVSTFTISSFVRGWANSADRTAAFDGIAPDSPAKGDVLFFNGTNWTKLDASTGSDGNVLTLDTAGDGVKWAVAAVVPGGGGGTPPDDNIEPIHLLKFDEASGTTVNDYGTSASLMVGTLTTSSWTSSGLPTVAEGNVSALRVDTSNYYVSFTNEFIDDVNGPFTVMGRVRLHADGIDDFFNLMGTNHPDGFNATVSSTGSGQAVFSCSWDNSNIAFTGTASLPSLETWYHWCVRRDADSLVSVFIDGALIGTYDATALTMSAAGDPGIGPFRIACGTSAGFDADDYQSFDVALTDEQIAAIADGGYAGAPVNEAPVITKPADFSMTQDTTHTFVSDVSIADADAGSSPVRLSITCSHGTATLDGTTGLTFTTGDGTADATMVFTGTITNINNALSGMTFTPTTSYTGAASIVLVCNDLGNTGSGGAKEDTKTIGITVNSSGPPAGYSAWWKPESLSGSDGDRLTAWADSSGNSYDLANSTGDNRRPVLKTAQINGYSCARFLVSESRFFDVGGGFTAPLTDLTFLVVCKRGSGGSTAETIFWSTGQGTPAFAAGPAIYSYTGGGNADKLSYVQTGGTDHLSSSTFTVADGWQVISYRKNGTAYEFKKGTSSIGTGTDSDTYYSGTPTCIGRAPSGAFYWDGDIAEIIWYPDNLNDTDWDSLIAYARSKYGL